MAEVFLKRTQSGFEPDAEHDAVIVQKIPFGHVVKAVITRPRNLQFHRKWWALVNVTFNNQDKYDTIEDYYLELKLKTGHYREHITTKGKIIYVPKSMSFASCDELEFSERYSRAIDVILRDFIPTATAEEIDAWVLQVLDFS